MALLIAVALTATACSSSGGIDGPVLTRPAPPLGGGGGDDALVGGVLTYDDVTGCLRGGPEGLGSPLIWPSGTKWSEADQAVVIDGGLVPMRSTVLGGGGYHNRQRVAAIAGDAIAAAAARCAGPTGEIGVYNARADIEVTLP